ncbi:MAG: hypothetical protein ACRCTR_09625 [Actinomycetota bacterium]
MNQTSLGYFAGAPELGNGPVDRWVARHDRGDGLLLAEVDHGSLAQPQNCQEAWPIDDVPGAVSPGLPDHVSDPVQGVQVGIGGHPVPAPRTLP